MNPYHLRTAFNWGAALAAATFTLALLVTNMMPHASQTRPKVAAALSLWLFMGLVIASAISTAKIKKAIAKAGLTAPARIASIRLGGHAYSGARALYLDLDVDSPEQGTFRTTAAASTPTNEPDLYYRVGDRVIVLIDPYKKRSVLLPPATRVRR